MFVAGLSDLKNVRGSSLRRVRGEVFWKREKVKQTNIVVVKKQTNIISIFAWLIIFMTD